VPRKCNYVFRFNCWATWHCQQYKTRGCFHVYAKMDPLYTAVELQNILYCCKQYKCTRSPCKVTDIGPRLTKFGFSWQTFIQVSNFTQICSVAAASKRVGGQTHWCHVPFATYTNRYNRINNTWPFPSQEKELDFIKSSQFSVVKI